MQSTPAYAHTTHASLMGRASECTEQSADRERLRRVLFEHHALTWRTLRRFGVSHVRVDEAVSRVFDVLARRLSEVEVERERAFIINVCTHVASEFRRAEAE